MIVSVTRPIAAVACIALAAVSGWIWLGDVESRRPAQEFVRQFHVEERRPEYAATIRYAPAADLAGEVAADIALQDALGSVSFADVPPETRRLWIETLGSLDAELESARGLLLDAVGHRPGWPYHRSLLGMVEYVRARRRVQLGGSMERWLTPLELTVPAAPADPSAAVFASAALIEAAPHRGALDRARALPVFAAAMHDPAFVDEHYLDLVDLLGHEAVWRLMPDAAAPLRAAVRAEASTGDVQAAAALYPRWERAELRIRQSDLEAIQLRAKRDDAARVRAACAAWARQHSVFDFDSPVGREQAAALLAIWPAEPGAWLSDPRSDFIRFFLDRPGNVDGHALARAASALDGAPRPVLARALLRAGDASAAQTVARNSETRGSFEWTPFYVDLAYAQLRNGNRTEAAAALDAIAPAAQNECDVALARAAISGARPLLTASAYSAAGWSNANLPLCAAPDRRTFNVRWDAGDGPALIEYGFDQGRAATRLLQPGAQQIAVPLEGRIGRHIFSYRVIAGGGLTPLEATLQ